MSTVRSGRLGGSYWLYLNSLYSDVTLMYNGTKIPAHRVILDPKSAEFQKMATEHTRENGGSAIELHQYDSNVLQKMLEIMYCGDRSSCLAKGTLNKETAALLIELFVMGDDFGMEAICGYASDAFGKALGYNSQTGAWVNKTALDDIIQIANVLDARFPKSGNALWERVLSLMAHQIHDLLKSDSFVNLVNNEIPDISNFLMCLGNASLRPSFRGMDMGWTQSEVVNSEECKGLSQTQIDLAALQIDA